MLNAFKLLSAVTPGRLKTGLNESYQRVKCSFSKMLLSLNRAHVILHNDLIGSQTKWLKSREVVNVSQGSVNHGLLINFCVFVFPCVF